jgi:hypothetical protein
MLYQLDLDPVFNEEGDAVREFEKRVVNQKRFVTKVKKGTAETNFGTKMVFEFEKGAEVNKDFAIELLELSKTTMPQFREKFDWSKKKKSTAAKQAKDAGVVSMEGGTQDTEKPEAPKTEEKAPSEGGTFSFKDIKF